MHNLHRHLCELLADDSLTRVLNIGDDNTINEFFKLYANDYLRVMHKVSHDMMKEEYEVCIL